VSLAFLVVEDRSLFSQSKHVALRTNYKIKIAQHKHTIHSNKIKQDNNQKSLYGTKVWHEVWLARYGLIDWKGHVL
jgi:hypothetical protein